MFSKLDIYKIQVRIQYIKESLDILDASNVFENSKRESFLQELNRIYDEIRCAKSITQRNSLRIVDL